MAPAISEPLLALEALRIEYGAVSAVRDVTLSLDAGGILGVVGKSGSGKSTIGYAVMGHLGSGRVAGGAIRFDGRDLKTLRQSDWARLRGRGIGMVYQEPQSALNPAYTIGEQIAEGLRHHFALTRTAARERALAWIERVHLPDPATIYRRFPHQLSGGQLQRAVIGMAFSMEPRLVIMDEPTTGLDITTQARILDLVADLRAGTGVAILYISHDLGVVAEICEGVAVLHRGRIVEEGRAAAVLSAPRHPYTQRLVASIPDLHLRLSIPGGAGVEKPPPIDEGCSFRARCPGALESCATPAGSASLHRGEETVRCWRADEIVPIHAIPAAGAAARPAAGRPLLETRALMKIYRSAGGSTLACDDVSIDIRRGETLALVGESGSGKSTTARCILGLEQPTSGDVLLDGIPLPARAHQRSRALRRRIQIVFQNPDGSLNGRRTIGDTLRRPLLIHGRASTKAAADALGRELLASVDLTADYLRRYPQELSGGEKQRIAIARALACEPDLIVCDEPVSALDVSVQSTILELCRRLQSEKGVAFLFITHDLGVVRQIAHRACVMYQGRICQTDTVDALFSADAHPYVRRLIASIPGQSAKPTAMRQLGRAS